MTTSFRSRLLAQRALMHRLRQPQRRNPLQAGFTLIELLIVVIIIGILASIALPAFLNQRDRAAESAAEAEARSFANSCLAGTITGDQPDDFNNQGCDIFDFTTTGTTDVDTTQTDSQGNAITVTVSLGSGGAITGVEAQ